MSEDTEAREVFDILRGGPEPVWHPDADAFAGAGRRRIRSRNLAVAAGAATLSAAVAVAAVVGFGSGGGPAMGPATAPAPGQSAGLDYVSFGTIVWKPGTDPLLMHRRGTDVPDTAVEDALTIVTRLDPGLRHIVKVPAADSIQVLPHGDPVFGKMTDLIGFAKWTPTGADSRQGGTLTVGFKDSPTSSGPTGRVGCGADIEAADTRLDPVPGVPDGAKWSSCTRTPLADGSVLLSSSKSYGSYQVLAVERDFPNGGGTVGLVWQNFLAKGPLDLYSDSTLSPSPITASQLAAAVSGPEIRPALGTSDPTERR